MKREVDAAIGPLVIPAVVSLSAGSRFVARDWNATRVPSEEIVGWTEGWFPSAPAAPLARLTSVVVLATRSRMKTSALGSVAAGSRLLEPE